MELADSFSEEGQLTDNRIKRICELLQTSVDLSDYKVRLTEEYFKNISTISRCVSVDEE